jgi:hypothetical protein
MNEAEAFEFSAMYIANVLTAFTVYITFTFAYLVAAFFVGRQLTRYQALVASILYVFSAGSAEISMLANIQWMGVAVAHAGNLAPTGIVQSTEFWEIYLGVLTSSGILISLYFMWDVRHPKTE